MRKLEISKSEVVAKTTFLKRDSIDHVCIEVGYNDKGNFVTLEASQFPFTKDGRINFKEASRYPYMVLTNAEEVDAIVEALLEMKAKLK